MARTGAPVVAAGQRARRADGLGGPVPEHEPLLAKRPQVGRHPSRAPGRTASTTRSARRTGRCTSCTSATGPSGCPGPRWSAWRPRFALCRTVMNVVVALTTTVSAITMDTCSSTDWSAEQQLVLQVHAEMVAFCALTTTGTVSCTSVWASTHVVMARRTLNSAKNTIICGIIGGQPSQRVDPVFLVELHRLFVETLLVALVLASAVPAVGARAGPSSAGRAPA